MRPPTRPAPVNRHRALPGCHQQPGARGALPAFTKIRLTGLVAGCTPTAHPAGTRSLPPATTPRPQSQARSEPPTHRAASLLWATHVRQVWGCFRNEGASTTRSLSLYLSVSLARTRASGIPPGRHVVGTLDLRRAIPRLGRPQLLRAAASAQGRHSSRHGRDVGVRHLLTCPTARCQALESNGHGGGGVSGGRWRVRWAGVVARAPGLTLVRDPGWFRVGDMMVDGVNPAGVSVAAARLLGRPEVSAGDRREPAAVSV